MCGKTSWDVVLYIQNNEALGVWPFYKKKKYGLTYMTQPQLTPYLGPFIILPPGLTKSTTILKYHKKILHSLAEELPSALLHISQGDPMFQNWLPLSWKGFKQTTRYTYRIDLNKSLGILNEELADKTRNRIETASQQVKVRKSLDSNLIFDLVQKSFARQNLKAPITREFFIQLDQSLLEHEAREAYVAYHKNEAVAVVYIINDLETSYLLLTGRAEADPGGAVGLLVWHAIENAKKSGKSIFDFEGSMIEPIESFFRSFGGQLTPYHRLYRTPGKWAFLLLKMLNRI